jgi:hypothetical protein
MTSFQITSAIIGQIKAGQIKALAVATDKRSDLISDVPTMAEAGMPDFNTPLWFGLLAPRRHAASPDRGACRGGETGDVCAGYRGLAAQTGVCA